MQSTNERYPKTPYSDTVLLSVARDEEDIESRLTRLEGTAKRELYCRFVEDMDMNCGYIIRYLVEEEAPVLNANTPDTEMSVIDYFRRIQKRVTLFHAKIDPTDVAVGEFWACSHSDKEDANREEVVLLGENNNPHLFVLEKQVAANLSIYRNMGVV